MKRLPLPERPTRQEAPSQQGELQRLSRSLWKKISYITLTIIVTLLIVWAFRPTPVQVDTSQIQQGELLVTVNAEGKTRVRDRFVIAADTDGRLVRIGLSEGDAITPGMTVAQIDPLPLNASVQQALGRLAEWQAQRAGVATQRPKAETVEQARTRIRAAEAKQQQAEAKVSQARAALTQAQRDLERSQQLAATGAISQNSLEVAELNATTKSKELETAILVAQAETAAVDVAKAALAVVQQEQADPDYLLRVYDARIASTEAELTKLRDEAARTVIRAPVAGKILRIYQKSAQFVSAGTPLLEVGDPAQLELVIDVLSSDAVQVKPGNPIWVEGASDPAIGPESIPAQVRRVEPSAFTKTSALGVEEQRVNVIGDFIHPTQPFGDAYRVDTRIVIWQGKNILKTPISALFRCQQSAWCVFVVEHGKADQRQIRIGHRNDREAEIKQGLHQGEMVILHPTEQIKAGIRVTSR